MIEWNAIKGRRELHEPAFEIVQQSKKDRGERPLSLVVLVYLPRVDVFHVRDVYKVRLCNACLVNINYRVLRLGSSSLHFVTPPKITDSYRIRPIVKWNSKKKTKKKKIKIRGKTTWVELFEEIRLERDDFFSSFENLFASSRPDTCAFSIVATNCLWSL